MTLAPTCMPFIAKLDHGAILSYVPWGTRNFISKLMSLLVLFEIVTSSAEYKSSPADRSEALVEACPPSSTSCIVVFLFHSSLTSVWESLLVSIFHGALSPRLWWNSSMRRRSFGSTCFCGFHVSSSGPYSFQWIKYWFFFHLPWTRCWSTFSTSYSSCSFYWTGFGLGGTWPEMVDLV